MNIDTYDFNTLLLTSLRLNYGRHHFSLYYLSKLFFHFANHNLSDGKCEEEYYPMILKWNQKLFIFISFFVFV